MERVPQDARGAAAADDLRAGHHRGPEGAPDCGRSLPPVRLRPADRRAGGDRAASAWPRRRGSRSRQVRWRWSRGTPPEASATPWAPSSSSSPTPEGGRSSRPTCLRCSGWPTPSSCSRRSTRSLRATPLGRFGPRRTSPTLAGTPANSCATSRSTGRELLAVQVLGDVPPEFRVTPERDIRLAEQATALSPHRRGPPARPRFGRARGDRQRRPGSDPA